MERNHDFRVWLESCSDATGDGHGRKTLGGRVYHDRFDFFPHVELVLAIALIDILHLEIGKGRGEGQHDGVCQTRTHVWQGGSVKR